MTPIHPNATYSVADITALWRCSKRNVYNNAYLRECRRYISASPPAAGWRGVYWQGSDVAEATRIRQAKRALRARNQAKRGQARRQTPRLGGDNG